MRKPILLIIFVVVSACNNPKQNSTLNDLSVHNDTTVITNNLSIRNRIQTETVTTELHKSKLTASGIVRAIPNNYAEVASPFAGRIVKSFVRLGQKVRVGSPIFEISSPSYFEAGKYYYQAKQEMELAEKNLNRQRDLLVNGVGIQKDVEEAEVHYELAKRDYENCVASLKVFHVNHEELILGQPLVIRSPISGEIVENTIVIGQYLKEDAGPVVIVAELSKVWIVGQLKEKDINSVHITDEVKISLTGNSEVEVTGTVYHISEILDEETRSVQVFIECDNNDRLLKPGMYVSAHFSTPSEPMILIPSSSILQDKDSPFVFLQTDTDRFVRRKVDIAGTENNLSIVKAGLNSGDIIVTRGSILLIGEK